MFTAQSFTRAVSAHCAKEIRDGFVNSTFSTLFPDVSLFDILCGNASLSNEQVIRLSSDLVKSSDPILYGSVFFQQMLKDSMSDPPRNTTAQEPSVSKQPVVVAKKSQLLVSRTIRRAIKTEMSAYLKENKTLYRYCKAGCTICASLFCNVPVSPCTKHEGKPCLPCGYYPHLKAKSFKRLHSEDMPQMRKTGSNIVNPLANQKVSNNVAKSKGSIQKDPAPCVSRDVQAKEPRVAAPSAFREASSKMEISVGSTANYPHNPELEYSFDECSRDSVDSAASIESHVAYAQHVRQTELLAGVKKSPYSDNDLHRCYKFGPYAKVRGRLIQPPP